jgi:hypothetical protein
MCPKKEAYGQQWIGGGNLERFILYSTVYTVYLGLYSNLLFTVSLVLYKVRQALYNFSWEKI